MDFRQEETPMRVGGGDLRRRSVPQKLRDQRDELRQRISELDEAIAALEANPEVEKIFHLVSKVLY